jgi:hypothetical protein
MSECVHANWPPALLQTLQKPTLLIASLYLSSWFFTVARATGCWVHAFMPVQIVEMSFKIRYLEYQPIIQEMTTFNSMRSNLRTRMLGSEMVNNGLNSSLKV